jgi:hypothetical protein
MPKRLRLVSRVNGQPTATVRKLRCGKRKPRFWTNRRQLGNKRDAATGLRLANEKSRVPDTFQLGAIPDARAFLASRKISNLRVFNTAEYSDSPRLHQTFRLYWLWAGSTSAIASEFCTPLK